MSARLDPFTVAARLSVIFGGRCEPFWDCKHPDRCEPRVYALPYHAIRALDAAGIRYEVSAHDNVFIGAADGRRLAA